MSDNLETNSKRLETKENLGKALVPIQESRMDFHGDELQVVLVEVEEGRQIYVPIRQFCDYLGLDWSGQYRRIERDEELRETLSSVVVTTTLMPVRGQRQSYSALCLPLDLLPGWLFTLSPG